MRSKLDIVWKSLGCACKQQSWYVGDHQYGQFYWREKKKKKKSAWAFCFHSPLRIIPAGEEKMPFSPPFFLLLFNITRPHREQKKLDLHSSGGGRGKTKQNKTSDHKQLIWSNLIRPVLLPPAGQGVTAQSATQRLRRHFFQGNSAFP